MHTKALILDLDNTIYPVKSIGEELFKPIFEKIENNGAFEGDFAEVKAMMMKQPFQKVADDFSFSEQLKDECLQLLPTLAYDKRMEPFPDYKILQTIPCKKFLVTTGFSKMQQTKIRQLDLEKDFEQCIVVDPSQSLLTKKDIFHQILQDHQLEPKEVVVIGDDMESEIKAAQELGIEAILYNHNGEKPGVKNQKTITTYNELATLLK